MFSKFVVQVYRLPTRRMQARTWWAFGLHTIMDKSLGTNSHLTRAKPTVRREFIYTCSAPLPPTMLDKCTCYFSRVSTSYGGKGGGEGGESNAI